MHNYNRKAYLNVGRLLWDALFVLAAFVLAVMATRAIHSTYDWLGVLWMPILYAMVFLFCMYNHGLYETTTFTYQDRTLRGVTASCLCASAACAVFLLFMPRTQGNTDILAFQSLLGVLVMGLRYFFALAAGQRRSGRMASQVLLVGDPAQMRSYLYYLEKTSLRVQPVGFLSDLTEENVRDVERLGGVADLERMLQTRVVDEVVLAWSRQDMAMVKPLLNTCAHHGVLTKVALDVWEMPQAKCHVHSVGPMPVLIYHRSNLSSLQAAVKRAQDIVLGIIGLAAALVLLPFCALAQGLHGGPVFVQVERIGRNGRPFRQLRFCMAGKGQPAATRQPEQMTAFGRLLLRSKLHYLPSFWNVLKGEMSAVGTRGALQPDVEGHHPNGAAFKPGLTGLWHINDFDRTLDEDGLGRMDARYAEQWSLGMDVRILLLSPVIFLIHRIIGRVADAEEPS